MILTQATDAPTSPDAHSVILDLDMIKEDPQFFLDDEVWAMLEKLRTITRITNSSKGALRQGASTFWRKEDLTRLLITLPTTEPSDRSISVRFQKRFSTNFGGFSNVLTDLLRGSVFWRNKGYFDDAKKRLQTNR